jgi:intraflagellar transport protein 56
MASALFLSNRYEEANVYFHSIKEHMFNNDTFYWNYGISLASAGLFKEGEEMLVAIQNERWREEFTYIYWLVKCYIWNSTVDKAWKLYLSSNNSEDSFQLLEFIANECYRKGKNDGFYYSAKAFDTLHKLETDNNEYWEGKRGACIGFFQQVVAGLGKKEQLFDVIKLLQEDDKPQAMFIIRVIKKWLDDDKIMKMKHIVGSTLDDSMSSLEGSWGKGRDD